MTQKSRSRAALLAQRLLGLFVAGALLLNFPLLKLGLGGGTWWGLPRLPLLLFVLWGLLIALLAWALERRGGAAQD